VIRGYRYIPDAIGTL